jgi:hypothetical protein
LLLWLGTHCNSKNQQKKESENQQKLSPTDLAKAAQVIAAQWIE